MSVSDILETMDYGPAPESDTGARAWLAQHDARFGHFIGGEFTAPGSALFDSRNPATGETLAQVSQGDGATIDAAVAAARSAQADWARLTPHQRSRYLYALARLVQKHARLRPRRPRRLGRLGRFRPAFPRWPGWSWSARRRLRVWSSPRQ